MSNKEQGINLNWGKGLFIVIALFICTTLGVVAYIISLDYYVVSENYYERAENYQEHINRVEQTEALDQPVTVELVQGNSELIIRFPSFFSGKTISGQIDLYRPNNSGLDKKVELALDDSFIQRISTSNLAKGKWLVKITWSAETKNYYKQESIFL